jgi:hypothetical protein
MFWFMQIVDIVVGVSPNSSILLDMADAELKS